MIKRLFFLFTIFILPIFSYAEIKVSSLPNPNLFPIFIIEEKGFANLKFIPAVGDGSTLVGFIRSGKVDAVFFNYEAAEKLTKETGWIYAGSTISKAVHIITKYKISAKGDLEGKKIVGSFRGGSPDILFRKLNLKTEPIFTDLQVAFQMFVNGDADAIFLPEPHVSNLLLRMRTMNREAFVYDIISLSGKDYRYPINATIVKNDEIKKVLKDALEKAVEFINSNPKEAIKIFEVKYKRYYNTNFPVEALSEAITSGRLRYLIDE
ncbi:MAG: hypothetical protein LDL10_01700 [Calditerrivibrio sp.]|nr:hypothetical protein [Calditerrivibrio sp.]MCA1980237.1 hypothetical protein [Calditerrivibrio sp.]